MAEHKNFLIRAFEAVIAGREREAQRYVARFEREHGPMNARLTKR
ncbi:MAG: hypothetical protein P0Y65_04140 [Candidatus Devosia phytovorans]|uniref:Uncharacterized protein n=1 Tax=Candidatus Devosia phytovorans TaxID=3121372 RepID=A0AAJ5VWF7_9HYPH|nr:hypothetical protein [Devosia sp.]WEK05455.1 MAG: hypothetical protein P0Y65_04140 [Devosia sp.]